MSNFQPWTLQVLPDDWEVTSIGNHLIGYRGGAPLTPGDFTDEGVKVLPKKGVSEIGILKISEEDQAFTSYLFAKKYSRSLIKGNHFLVTTLRDLVPSGPSIGLIVLLNSEEEYVLAQGVYAFELQESLDRKFLVCLSQTPQHRQQMHAMMVGSTQVHIRTEEFFKTLIPLPSIDEQKKITAILTTVDRLIEKTEALIAKYQAIKQGMMHDLFTRGVDENGHLRPPYEQAPELYKESAIGWIPKEWEAKTVGEMFEIQLGKMLSRASKTGRNSAPYLANRNVQWGKVDLLSLETMDFSLNEREKFSLLPGDLLVCEGGEVGRTALWNGEMEKCYYQKAIHRLRPKEGQMLPIFMMHFMRYAADLGWFTDFTTQTSIAHLTREKLLQVPVMTPPIEEQKEIAKRLDALDCKSDNEKEQLGKLSKLKTGLMQDLLTGKVRVKTPATPTAA